MLDFQMEDSSNTDIQPSESETGTESAEEKSEHQNESGAGEHKFFNVCFDFVTMQIWYCQQKE